jgi:hypothetical protein
LTRRGCAIAVLVFACGLAAINERAHAGEWTGIAFEQPAIKGMRCWYVLPDRIVADDADLPFEGTPREFVLRAGRNEYDCAQLVLLRTTKANDVHIEFSDFTAKTGGATLVPSWFRANKLGQISGTIASHSPESIATWDMIAPDASPAVVTPATYLPSSARVIPDRLLHAETFDLDAGITRIWLTLHVPADAKAGDYRGTVRLVKSNGEPLHELPLAVRIWNYVLPDEPSMNVMADVRPTTRPAKWSQLQPFYDDLKAHRINATGEILPPPLWRHDEPPPAMDEYEAALKHVLDDLGFARFRFPNGAQLEQLARFERPAYAVANDGVWISEPAPHVNDDNATLAQFSERHAAGEYAFVNTLDEPAWLWVQADVRGADERKVVQIDNTVVGEIAGESFLANALSMASLPQPIELGRGRHTLRIESGGDAAVHAIFLTPQREPDFETLLRQRIVLSTAARDAIRFHAEQMSDWLRARGWLKKSHVKFDDAASVADFGRIAVLHDFIGEVLPTVRRELTSEPSAALRKMVEVWTPDLGRSANFDPDDWQRALEPGQELWASNASLHAPGIPPLAMRLIPWTLARHNFDGYVIGPINRGHTGLITSDARTSEPIDSVRFELLREGLEDYETLRLLRSAIDAAIGSNESDAAKLVAIRRGQELFDMTIPALVRSAYYFSWDAAALHVARLEAAEILSLLSPP